MAELLKIVTLPEFKKLPVPDQRLLIREFGAEDPDFSSLNIREQRIIEADIIRRIAPGLGQALLKTGGVALRALRIPQQMIGALGIDEPLLERPFQQVLDPSKQITPEEFTTKTFGEVMPSEGVGGALKRTGLGTAFEVADPLILTGAPAAARSLGPRLAKRFPSIRRLFEGGRVPGEVRPPSGTIELREEDVVRALTKEERAAQEALGMRRPRQPITTPLRTQEEVEAFQRANMIDVETAQRAGRITAELSSVQLNVETMKKVNSIAQNIILEFGIVSVKETKRQFGKRVRELFKTDPDAARALARKGPEPGYPATLQIMEAIETKPEAFASLLQKLEAAGVPRAVFGSAIAATASNAGRTLGILGNLQRTLNRVAAKNKDMAKLLNDAGFSSSRLTGWQALGYFTRREADLFRAAIVSAWSTAVRNVVTQLGRLGLNAVDDLLKATFNQVLRRGNVEDRVLGPIFRQHLETFQTLFSKGRRADLDAIFRGSKAGNEAANSLFFQYLSDVSKTSKELKNLGRFSKGVDRMIDVQEKAYNYLNFLNQGQEMIIGSAVFRGKLIQKLEIEHLKQIRRLRKTDPTAADALKRRGFRMDEIDPTQIDPEIIADSVETALDTVFRLNPKGGLFKDILAVYRLPKLGTALKFISPFPRFLYNSLKFNFEHSPAGLLRLLSKAERAKLAAGDSNVLSRATIGSGLFYGAWELRNDPDIAGDKWYELNISGFDKPVDMRPFAPFAQYLFVAELVKKINQGATGAELKDFIKLSQIIPANRAGASLALLENVDRVIESITDADIEQLDKLTLGPRQLVGEVLGGFFQPLTTFRELYASYGKFLRRDPDDPSTEPLSLSEQIGESAFQEGQIRSVREDPLLGPAKRRIPLLSQSLPERPRILGTEPIRLETTDPEIFGVEIPLDRQFTGISRNTKNLIQSEADTLGIQYSELTIRTGNPRVDRLIGKEMGPIVEKRIPVLFKQRSYKKGSNQLRRLKFTLQMKAIKTASKQRVLKRLSKGSKEDKEIVVEIRKRDLFRNRRLRELVEDKELRKKEGRRLRDLRERVTP